MKKIKFVLVFTLVICYAVSITAQTEKGNILLGGSSNLSLLNTKSKWKDDNDDGKIGNTFDFEFTPRAGYFIMDNLAIGLEFPISYSKYKDDNDNVDKETTYAIAPFARYYLGANKIKPFFQAEIGFGGYKQQRDPANFPASEETYGLFLFQFNGGASFFINEKVALDLSLGYSYLSSKQKEDNPDNYKTIHKGIGFGVGVIVVL